MDANKLELVFDSKEEKKNLQKKQRNTQVAKRLVTAHLSISSLCRSSSASASAISMSRSSAPSTLSAPTVPMYWENLYKANSGSRLVINLINFNSLLSTSKPLLSIRHGS